MLAKPTHWPGHHRGDSAAPRIKQPFGPADRIRSCWPHPRARAAVARLLADVDARLLADIDGRQLPKAAPQAWFAEPKIASSWQSPHSLPQVLAMARVQSTLQPGFFDPQSPSGGPRP